MAPTSCRSWMSTHRQTFGDVPVRDLCLPTSHDAGTYRRLFGTSFGTDANVLTQTRSIFDQLELGVRYLDIRPYLASPDGSSTLSWNCGHYTGEAYDRIGWQGGSCVPIQEVVDDVNRFTKDNPELVILDVSHINGITINNPLKSGQFDPDEVQLKSLVKLLSGINNLFTLERAGGDKARPVQDWHLNDFIRDNRAAVVVIVHWGRGRDELYENGLWPDKTSDGRDTYGGKGTSVTRMQSTADAVSSTLKSWLPQSLNGDSVLMLAAKEQEREFPWLLQKVATGDLPCTIALDRIENTDLLTLCLAVAYQRCNNIRGLNDKVIIYGGQLITDSGVHREVQTAIDNGKSFRVSNGSLRCDPWAGMVKSCAVYYRQDGLLKGRWAKEGGVLHFELDVLSVTYGPKQIRDQGVYLRLLRCIKQRDLFLVNNDNMGGDPQPNVRKDLSIRWRDENDSEVRDQKTQEYKYLDFETFWEKVARGAASGHGPI